MRDALEGAGVKAVSPPLYFLADDSTALLDAKAAAIRQAQTEAAAYADALQLRVDHIVRVSEAGADGDPFGGAPNFEDMVRTMTGQGRSAIEGTVETAQTIRAEFVLLPR